MADEKKLEGGQGRDAVKVLIPASAVQRRIAELGAELGQFYGASPPLIVGVLNGAAYFMMALIDQLPSSWQAHLEYDFIDLSSYDGSVADGQVTLQRNVVVDLAGRQVLIVEGVVDTGGTLAYLQRELAERNVAGIKICSLLDKPARRRDGIAVDWSGFIVDDLFVIGCGMDYRQRYRALPFVGVLSG